jgi:hypothetical protein
MTRPAKRKKGRMILNPKLRECYNKPKVGSH